MILVLTCWIFKLAPWKEFNRTFMEAGSLRITEACSYIVPTVQKVTLFYEGHKNNCFILMLPHVAASCSADIYFNCKRILESYGRGRGQSYQSVCLYILRSKLWNSWSVLLTLRCLTFQLAYSFCIDNTDLSTEGLHLQSPRRYAWQTSARVWRMWRLLPHSHDCIYHKSWRILAPTPLWLQKFTGLRAYDFMHSPDLWLHLAFAEVTCAWSWAGDFVELILL